MDDSIHYCLSCAREFRPRSPDVMLCPDCGGPPEAEAPDRLPDRQALLDSAVPVPDSVSALLEPASSSPAPGETILEPVSDGASAEDGALAEWQPGDEILGVYTVVGTLGEGGMGKVYRVHHRSWNIDLALKSPHRRVYHSPEGRAAYIGEAEAWVELGLHPHIVTCHYVRSIGGVPRVFAELVEGGSLADWIRQGRISTVEQALDVAIQFAWGLAYAHERGLVHRDVKPANVLMTPDGAAKVTDFGLVKAGKGMSPAYASPEQAHAQHADLTLTPQADLWSWGLSLLEIFAGRAFWVNPVDPNQAWGQTAPQALEAYLAGDVEDPAIESMPDSLAELLRQCFQTDPIRRPPGLAAVADQLIQLYAQVAGAHYPRQQPRAAELRADSLNNKALSMLDLGRKAEAEQIWQQALEVDPFHPYAWYNLSLLRWRSAEIDDRTVVDGLEKISGSTARRLLGLIHLERDDCKSALELLEGLDPIEQEEEDVRIALQFGRQRMTQSTRLLSELEAHKFSVSALALRGDDRLVLSGSLMDPCARLWDLDTRQQVGAFEHGSGIGAVCLSPDGRLALTGGENKLVKVWDVATSSLLHTLKGHTQRISGLALSPDQRLALSSSYDGSVKVWDLSSGQLLVSLDGHSRSVNDVRLNRDGSLALSASFDQTVKVWQIPTGRCVRDLSGHTSFVDAVSISPDSRFALSASGNGEVKYWDIERGDCIRDLSGHAKSIKSAAISHDGNLALTGDIGGEIKLWDLSTGRCLRTLAGGKGQQFEICWSSDDHRAFSAVYDHMIQVWQIGRPETFFSAPYMLTRAVTGESALRQKQLYDQAWSEYESADQRKDYCQAARALRAIRSLRGFENDPGAIRAWGKLYSHLPKKSFRYGWTANAFSGEGGYPRGVALSRDGRFALCGSDSFGLKYYDAQSGRLQYEFPEARGVYSVGFSPDERLAISGGVGVVQIWELSTGRCLIRGETGTAVHALCLGRDGRFLFTCSRDIQYWDLETKRCITTIHVPLGSTINSMALSPDESTFLTAHHDKLLILWDAARAQPIWQITAHDHIINCAAISLDGRLALSGSVDRSLKLWDLASGKCLSVFNGHQNGIDGALFTPDSRFAISCSRDHTIKVWELSSGQCVYTLLGHANPVSAIGLSADGRYLFSAGWGGELKLWELEWELEERSPQDWEDSAAPHLNHFLQLHTPYQAAPLSPREAPPVVAAAALTRSGKPAWSEDEFNQLLDTLSCAGYGWLRPEGVRRKLEEMAARWK